MKRIIKGHHSCLSNPFLSSVYGSLCSACVVLHKHKTVLVATGHREKKHCLSVAVYLHTIRK